jgi:hypothetical protein
VDIWINGSYWAGAIIGSFVYYVFLNQFAVNVGWRLCFPVGPPARHRRHHRGLGAARKPALADDSRPRKEAEEAMAKIEEQIHQSGQDFAPVDESPAVELVPEKRYGYLVFLRLAVRDFGGGRSWAPA